LNNLDTDQTPDWLVALDKKVQLLEVEAGIPLELVEEADCLVLMVDGKAIQELNTDDREEMSQTLDRLLAYTKALSRAMFDYDNRDDDCEPYVPDFGPPGSGAVVTEYAVGTYDEPF